MVAWMNADTLQLTLDEGRMVYWSRSRQEVWRKGDTSGDRQLVREAYYDCDADALLFKVEQDGNGACHTGARIVLLPRVRLRGRSVEIRRRLVADDEFRRPTPPSTRSCRCGPSCSPTSRRRWPRS